MILKNIMEEKQLDLNRPFRSVRRVRRLPIAPPPPPAAATSQCDDTDSRKIETSLPRLPNLPAYKAELKSGPIRNPGTVPFLWEQSPGRPKDESKSKPRSLHQPPVAPKLPPGRILNVNRQSPDKGSEDKLRILNVDHQSSDKGSEDKLSSHSEDDSETYADANDTLSRTESSLLNCSVSGLSGLDGPCVKPFRALSDPHARDFMMGRFLPAAKAMASESPHYNTRKQDLNKTASVDKKQSLYPHRPPTYAQARHCEESEDDCDKELEYLSTKVCGLLPQFCPVPGLRLQGHVLAPSVPRSQAKPTEKPVKTHKNLREMLACKSTEWEVAEKTLYIDSNSRYSDTKETTQNDTEVLDKEETCSGDFRQDQDLVHDCKTSASSKMAQDVSTDARKKPDSSSCLPLPPPLPKSPSESWLSRALTASSARNQQHYNRAHASKTPPFDPKWETIVKTSNAHHDRLRFSEELLAPIPEA